MCDIIIFRAIRQSSNSQWSQVCPLSLGFMESVILMLYNFVFYRLSHCATCPANVCNQRIYSTDLKGTSNLPSKRLLNHQWDAWAEAGDWIVLLRFFVRPEPAWGTASFYSSIIHACPMRGPQFNPQPCRKRHNTVKIKPPSKLPLTPTLEGWGNVAKDNWGAVDSLTQYFLLPGKETKLNIMEAEASLSSCSFIHTYFNWRLR